jgi:hypothetical protein
MISGLYAMGYSRGRSRPASALLDCRRVLLQFGLQLGSRRRAEPVRRFNALARQLHARRLPGRWKQFPANGQDDQRRVLRVRDPRTVRLDVVQAPARSF